MSGLLERLARQALGARAAGAVPVIRSALSVHPRQPIALASKELRPTRNVERPPSTAHHSRPPEANPHAFPPPHESLTETSRGFPPPPPALDPSVDREEPRDGAESAANETSTLSNVSPTPRERQTSHAFPARLLDAVVPHAAPASLAAARIPADFASHPDRIRDAEQPMEVHVHIGRIDVTAEREPPAPKKHRKTIRETLPLAEYLSGRRS